MLSVCQIAFKRYEANEFAERKMLRCRSVEKDVGRVGCRREYRLEAYATLGGNKRTTGREQSSIGILPVGACCAMFLRSAASGGASL